jgi:hypothetical protein
VTDDAQSSTDDWLAGAELEATAVNLSVPGSCVSFDGLEMPEPDPDDNVA